MERFSMTFEEAQEFVTLYKAGLPTLFRWIGGMEKLAEMKGTVSTYFGRPRRLKSYFDTGEWGWISFAKRSATNTVVQGTGADILKIAMIKIFNTYYNNPQTGPLTKLVRFINTVHDEVNFQIYKDRANGYKTTKALIKKTMELMRFKLPEWSFMIDVGLGIGNRWGQSVDFDFDPNTLEILKPKSDPITDKDICKALGIVIEKKEEKPIEDIVDENFTIEY